MTVVMLSIFVAMVGIASQYPADARFMPFIVGVPAIALCLLQLGLDFRGSLRSKALAPAAHEEKTVGREWARTSWRFALGLTAAASVILYMVFVQGLGVALHAGFVTEYVLDRFSG
jgi:hypothetical protein